MSAQTDYISYLETKVCDQAWRIGQLEGALLYILTMKERDEKPDMVYMKASRELWNDLTMGLEMKQTFKRLTK